MTARVLLVLTTESGVAIVSNTKPARLLLAERRSLAEDRFVELVVWQVPQPVRASKQLFKYRLAFFDQWRVCAAV